MVVVEMLPVVIHSFIHSLWSLITMNAP